MHEGNINKSLKDVTDTFRDEMREQTKLLEEMESVILTLDIKKIVESGKTNIIDNILWVINKQNMPAPRLTTRSSR